MHYPYAALARTLTSDHQRDQFANLAGRAWQEMPAYEVHRRVTGRKR